jgi:hypothetical protein
MSDIKPLSAAARFGSEFFEPYWTEIYGREVTASVYVAAHDQVAYFVATRCTTPTKALESSATDIRPTAPSSVVTLKCSSMWSNSWS